MKEKVRLYVSSLKNISTLEFVDTESMGHPCVTSRHSETLFTQFKNLPKSVDSNIYNEEQVKLISKVSKLCKASEYDLEIIDVSNLNFLSQMKLVLKGVKTPQILFHGRKIEANSLETELVAQQ